MWEKAFWGVLFLSVWPSLLTSAYPYPATSTTWGVKLKCVEVWSEWLHVSNYDKKPTDVEVTIELLAVQLRFFNPGSQDGGVGQPFYPEITLTAEKALDEPILKNGKYLSVIEFKDETLLAAIPDLLSYYPNPNWELDDESPIDVLEMYVTIRGYSDLDLDKDGMAETTETARLRGTCTLNYDRTAYICVTEELCSWTNDILVCQ